jgi:regulator of nonsense transcripts 3
VLLGPPSLEFAPYVQVPGGRIRKDGRQGTIDQDPEFIDFLESLTNPITKPSVVDPGADGEKEDEVMTTPLVQYIKEKKANKIKENTSPTKQTKYSKSDKEGKPEKVAAKKLLKRPASPSLDRKSVERATREAVEVANKQAASIAAKTKSSSPSVSKAAPPVALLAAQPAAPPAAPPAALPVAPPSGDTTVPTAERKGRGDISAAAKIVRQHLGLVPSGGRRRSKAENPSSKTAEQSLPIKTSKEATTQDSTKDLNDAPPETVPTDPWPTDTHWPTDPGWSTNPGRSTDPWPANPWSADPGSTKPWDEPPKPWDEPPKPWDEPPKPWDDPPKPWDEPPKPWDEPPKPWDEPPKP